MVISMAIITSVKTRNITPPMGVSHSVQSKLLLWGSGGGSGRASASKGAGMVAKAPTALQAL